MKQIGYLLYICTVGGLFMTGMKLGYIAQGVPTNFQWGDMWLKTKQPVTYWQEKAAMFVPYILVFLFLIYKLI